MKLSLMFISVLVILLAITGCNDSAKPTSSIQTTEGNSVQQQSSLETNVKTDSGRYNGQIDSNSIEIKISGVPGGMEPQAFRLSELIKEKFNTYKLNVGDAIRFNYIVNEHGQNIILELTVLTPPAKAE